MADRDAFLRALRADLDRQVREALGGLTLDDLAAGQALQSLGRGSLPSSGVTIGVLTQVCHENGHHEHQAPVTYDRRLFSRCKSQARVTEALAMLNAARQRAEKADKQRSRWVDPW